LPYLYVIQLIPEHKNMRLIFNLQNWGILLVPFGALRVVPIQLLQWYRFADTITETFDEHKNVA